MLYICPGANKPSTCQVLEKCVCLHQVNQSMIHSLEGHLQQVRQRICPIFAIALCRCVNAVMYSMAMKLSRNQTSTSTSGSLCQNHRAAALARKGVMADQLASLSRVSTTWMQLEMDLTENLVGTG